MYGINIGNNFILNDWCFNNKFMEDLLISV